MLVFKHFRREWYKSPNKFGHESMGIYPSPIAVDSVVLVLVYTQEGSLGA